MRQGLAAAMSAVCLGLGACAGAVAEAPRAPAVESEPELPRPTGVRFDSRAAEQLGPGRSTPVRCRRAMFGVPEGCPRPSLLGPLDLLAARGERDAPEPPLRDTPPAQGGPSVPVDPARALRGVLTVEVLQ